MSKILQNAPRGFRPSLSYQLLFRSLICLFLSGHFTQVLLPVSHCYNVDGYTVETIITLLWCGSSFFHNCFVGSCFFSWIIHSSHFPHVKYKLWPLDIYNGQPWAYYINQKEESIFTKRFIHLHYSLSNISHIFVHVCEVTRTIWKLFHTLPFWYMYTYTLMNFQHLFGIKYLPLTE